MVDIGTVGAAQVLDMQLAADQVKARVQALNTIDVELNTAVGMTPDSGRKVIQFKSAGKFRLPL